MYTTTTTTTTTVVLHPDGRVTHTHSTKTTTSRPPAAAASVKRPVVDVVSPVKPTVDVTATGKLPVGAATSAEPSKTHPPFLRTFFDEGVVHSVNTNIIYATASQGDKTPTDLVACAVGTCIHSHRSHTTPAFASAASGADGADAPKVVVTIEGQGRTLDTAADVADVVKAIHVRLLTFPQPTRQLNHADLITYAFSPHPVSPRQASCFIA